MCFSAAASFTVSALLAPAGLYASKIAWDQDSRYFPLAIAPLAFGIQQGFEGIAWLGLDGDQADLVWLGGAGVFIVLPWILVSLASLDGVLFRVSALGEKVASGHRPDGLFMRRLPLWAISALF